VTINSSNIIVFEIDHLVCVLNYSTDSTTQQKYDDNDNILYSSQWKYCHLLHFSKAAYLWGLQNGIKYVLIHAVFLFYFVHNAQIISSYV